MVLCFFIVQSQNYPKFILAIEQYFVCEAAGTGIECDYSDIDQYTYAGLESLLMVTFGLAPVTNLIFVVNWTVAKAMLKSKLMKLSGALSYTLP